MTSASRREYQRAWYAKNKKESSKVRTDFDNFVYRSVPNSWRELPVKPQEYNTPEITSPLVLDILQGKTILVDFTLPHGAFNNHPFRTLYSYCNTRGYRLRVHVIDVPDKEEFRKLLMWAEPIKPVKYSKIKEAA